MTWMAETFERRVDPRKLMGDAKSVVMLGLNYGPSADPRAALERRDVGAISVYARHRDYHDVLKGKLKALASFLAGAAGAEKADVKVFVDTAPLLEKPLAARAGLGWQGKHTNLVSREFGSWLFLGAILTNLELPPDAPESDHCGQCRACLDACPTGAFPAPYQLDARRCISYLTIEHKGPIPREFRSAIGNRIYGCDDCLAVCPWNKFASQGREAKLAARADLDAPPLGRTRPPRRGVVPVAVRGRPDQAHRPGALPAQCDDRDRELEGSRASPPRRRTARTMNRRWCAERRSGRSRNCFRGRNSRRSRRSAWKGSVTQRLSRSGATLSPRRSDADRSFGVSVRGRGLRVLPEPLDLVFEVKFLTLEFVNLDVV